VIKTAVRLQAEHKVNLGRVPVSVREETVVARVGGCPKAMPVASSSRRSGALGETYGKQWSRA
jgi:hypothetical protein